MLSLCCLKCVIINFSGKCFIWISNHLIIQFTCALQQIFNQKPSAVIIIMYVSASPPAVSPEINRADEELKINLNLPSKTEIKQAIKKLKTAKTSGPDNIPPEALKANPDLTASIFHKIYSDIWKNEVMPQDWNIGHLIKLPKKDNLKECKNYSGIALLSVVAKVLNRILLTRLLNLDEKLREQRAGFRKDRSCIDQIAAPRIIIEQSLEWNTSLFLNFVDFEKAFDSLDREVL